MTATLTITDLDPRAVRILPIARLDGAGEPCDQCDHDDCRNEGQMYYTSLFSGPMIVTGSLACLALLYRADADFDAQTTIEVQR